jgi:hypothetical protein
MLDIFEQKVFNEKQCKHMSHQNPHILFVFKGVESVDHIKGRNPIKENIHTLTKQKAPIM